MIALWWIMMNVTYCTQNDRHSRRLPPAYVQHGAEKSRRLGWSKTSSVYCCWKAKR